MINNIELYILVLSIVFVLRFVLEFIAKLFITTAEPLSINKYEKVTLYFVISYIITYIIT
tara:strand:+ start:8392 stop:8571 length:180 start_codon:yes stop_codon:yes gene_type:complete